ncbi:hypothetical protein [Vibrio anguillarum]|uniref:hypothetical protein n=1 Tax=Vibrio anguillarum TaxID=55601 RepID=UPI0016A9CDFB|nr:hypothetical protein [Vibrio anguillarum]NOI06340.1 hypothetical protein [Vibrio anguillarum]
MPKMTFYATKLGKSVIELAYIKESNCWRDMGSRYEFKSSNAHIYLPVEIQQNEEKCVEGYFNVGLTHPNGNYSVFRLNAENGKISIGNGVLYPGVSYDANEIDKLQLANISNSNIDFESIIDCICYLFNEAALTNDELIMRDEDNGAYIWKIL